MNQYLTNFVWKIFIPNFSEKSTQPDIPQLYPILAMGFEMLVHSAKSTLCEYVGI